MRYLVLAWAITLVLTGCQTPDPSSDDVTTPSSDTVLKDGIIPKELIHPLGIVKESTETSQTFQVYLELAVTAAQAIQYYQTLPEWSKELLVSGSGEEVLRLRKASVIADMVLSPNGDTSTAVITGLVLAE